MLKWEEMSFCILKFGFWFIYRVVEIFWVEVVVYGFYLVVFGFDGEVVFFVYGLEYLFLVYNESSILM